MDVHEAREDRLRRKRREDMRKREEERQKMERKLEREREREVAVEDSEDSSLSDEEGTKKACSGSKNAGTLPVIYFNTMLTPNLQRPTSRPPPTKWIPRTTERPTPRLARHPPRGSLKRIPSGMRPRERWR